MVIDVINDNGKCVCVYVCVNEHFFRFQNLSARFQFKYLIVEKTESQDMFSNKKCGKYKKLLDC